MGKNFIGPEELLLVSEKLGVLVPKRIPQIRYDKIFLQHVAKTHLLIFTPNKTTTNQPLTLNSLRTFFGIDPEVGEPCFYNQDWYVKEKFAHIALKSAWYLIRKDVLLESRAQQPDILEKNLKKEEEFPQAIFATFVFFAYYFLNNGRLLWKHDFIWCKDRDANGDRIYVGRYIDPKKINKNGFNIHRHLTLRPCYAATVVVQ